MLVLVLVVAGGLWLRSGGLAHLRRPQQPETLRERIVALVESRVGYRTDPTDSYCNVFSAYWDAGAATCGTGLRAEEWCADFAAWAWQQAGVHFTYGYGSGQIGPGAVSFYEWAVATGRWHPVGAGYVAQPGDVAVYGLDAAAGTATHVAVVIDQRPGVAGPDVVNGDGDRTGFSVVEVGRDEVAADVSGQGTLAGYASPPAA